MQLRIRLLKILNITNLFQLYRHQWQGWVCKQVALRNRQIMTYWEKEKVVWFILIGKPLGAITTNSSNISGWSIIVIESDITTSVADIIYKNKSWHYARSTSDNRRLFIELKLLFFLPWHIEKNKRLVIIAINTKFDFLPTSVSLFTQKLRIGKLMATHSIHPGSGAWQIKMLIR